MPRVIAVGIALLLSHSTLAFADAKRGSEAFARGDYLAANHEWRESAEAGDASAMLGLGILYDTGHGESQDFAKALAWYRRAAEAGNVRAMFNVGAMYDNGRGANANRSEAIRWYAKSAARGDGRAAYAAATIYRDGDGVPQNRAAAIKFFRMAAAAGINAARLNLASLGQGVPGASPAAVASQSRVPSVAPRGRESVAASTKGPSLVTVATADAATAKVEPLPPPVASPALPAQVPDTAAAAAIPSIAEQSATTDAATAIEKPSPLPAMELPEFGAPISAPSSNFAVAANDIPIGSMKPFGPSSVQVTAPGAIAVEIERFHRTALQRASVSVLLMKQYADVFGEVTRRAREGDEVAQYDTGFAYERGIGVPRDLVRSYVYYIRASLSPKADLKSAALRGAIDVGDQLTNAQQASAMDMLTHGTH